MSSVTIDSFDGIVLILSDLDDEHDHVNQTLKDNSNWTARTRSQIMRRSDSAQNALMRRATMAKTESDVIIVLRTLRLSIYLDLPAISNRPEGSDVEMMLKMKAH